MPSLRLEREQVRVYEAALVDLNLDKAAAGCVAAALNMLCSIMLLPGDHRQCMMDDMKMRIYYLGKKKQNVSPLTRLASVMLLVL